MSGDCVNGSAGPGTCVLDPAVLERLRSELDDDEGWRSFLSNFLAHLPRSVAPGPQRARARRVGAGIGAR